MTREEFKDAIKEVQGDLATIARQALRGDTGAAISGCETVMEAVNNLRVDIANEESRASIAKYGI